MRADGTIPSKLARTFAEACIETGRSLIRNTAELLPTDPWDFVTQCCITLDELEAGKTERKPFPSWDYLHQPGSTRYPLEDFVRI